MSSSPPVEEGRSAEGGIHFEVVGEGVGEGPALVLTHGFGGTLHTWDAQVEALAAQHRLVRWDLLGHGRSPVPEDPAAYSRERGLADLEGMIALAGADVVLVGHSLGGYLSQCRTLRSREGVRALVLVATGPGFRSDDKRALWNDRTHRVARMFGLAPQTAGLAAQPDAEVMAGLEKLDLPVLLIAGERDRQYTGAMRYMAGRLPRAESVVVPEAGHILHETHPAPVNAAIVAFLDRLR